MSENGGKVSGVTFTSPGSTRIGTRPGAAACVDRRAFSFRLHHPRGQRIVAARVSIDGRVVRTLHGRNLSRLTLARLPVGRFTVKIETRTDRGTRATSVRSYVGCAKTPPRNRFKLAQRKRRSGHSRSAPRR